MKTIKTAQWWNLFNKSNDGMIPCSYCKGGGKNPNGGMCPGCNGTGKVQNTANLRLYECGNCGAWREYDMTKQNTCSECGSNNLYIAPNKSPAKNRKPRY